MATKKLRLAIREQTRLLIQLAAIALCAGTTHVDYKKSYDFSGTLTTAIDGSTSVTGAFRLDFRTSTISAFPLQCQRPHQQTSPSISPPITNSRPPIPTGHVYGVGLSSAIRYCLPPLVCGRINIPNNEKAVMANPDGLEARGCSSTIGSRRCATWQWLSAGR
jgi:hypothetical protein